jgi:hypothetical protein
MTRSGFVRGSAIFAAMVIAGFFLGTYLDRHFTDDTDDDSGYHLTSAGRPQAAAPE